MKKLSFVHGAVLAGAVWLAASPSFAAPETYKIDSGHSFVTFSIAHLGFSLLQGRFNTVAGQFAIDTEKSEGGSLQVTVDTASIDTNHAERDKHLRSKDFLDVDSHPKAEFKSVRIVEKEGKARVDGELTLHGVTKPVSFEARFIGSGNDPWGGFRRGYAGTLHLKRADFGITRNLGPAAEEMDLGLYIEGVRQ
ncbi:MAG: YceI family protein [Magnetococcales bacterium]|nr:YceI family protein [Magnetococcales bacterium]